MATLCCPVTLNVLQHDPASVRSAGVFPFPGMGKASSS